MKTDLKTKTALVTGGSKGFGAGIAAVLRQRGMNVWITGRDERALHDTARRTGARLIRADVTSSKDWDRVVKTVMRKSGSLDVLINNAGAGIKLGLLSKMDDASIRRSIEVNLTGAVLGCARVAKIMIRQRRPGTIINVSSVCQRKAWVRFPVYSAAKAGLGQLSNCLYAELREHGIRVTTLIPSWGDTDFFNVTRMAGGSNKVLTSDQLAKSIQPEEFGEIVAFICELPSHLMIQDLTVWPMVQQVNPF